MADDVVLNPGAGGATVAADDVGGVHFQRVKLDGGADGASTPFIAGRQDDAESLPVALSNEAIAILNAIGALLAGTLTVGLPAGAATAAKQDTLIAKDFATQTTLAAVLAKIIAAPATEAKQDVSNGHLADLNAFEFETVAASQTDQMAGGAGAAGDYLAGVLIIPATTSPGAVSIEYGSTNITIFTGGADSVTDLKPFMVPLGIKSPSGGGWEITTGADVSAIAIGTFT